jgi:hypothetical protein
MSPRAVATHLYQPDLTLAPDHRDQRPCTCGMPKRWRGHDVPDTAEAAAEERRRLGERGGD